VHSHSRPERRSTRLQILPPRSGTQVSETHSLRIVNDANPRVSPASRVTPPPNGSAPCPPPSPPRMSMPPRYLTCNDNTTALPLNDHAATSAAGPLPVARRRLRHTTRTPREPVGRRG